MQDRPRPGIEPLSPELAGVESQLFYQPRNEDIIDREKNSSQISLLSVL